MSKVAVVYWSMTGNTEAMAKELASAADTEAIESSEFSADMCDQYDAFAFGCPAMGDEELILILRSSSMTAQASLARSQPLSLVLMTGEPVTGWRLGSRMLKQRESTLLRLLSATLSQMTMLLRLFAALVQSFLLKLHYDFCCCC